jgi:hypothetical protein
MSFIADHNSGDALKYFEMTQAWCKRLKPKEYEAAMRAIAEIKPLLT